MIFDCLKRIVSLFFLYKFIKPSLIPHKEKATTDNKLVFTGTLQWTCSSKFLGIL